MIQLAVEYPWIRSSPDEAGERFGQDVSIDVYGQFFPGVSKDDFRDLKRVTYRGVIPPETAISLMAQYHALLLPTYFPGEGYPGVIIEAYLAGIPVICTDWLGLSQIADETSGILIPPRDADALYLTFRTSRFHFPVISAVLAFK